MDIDDLRQRPWVLLPGTLCSGAVFDGFLDALGVAGDQRRTVLLSDPDVERYGDILTPITEGTILCGFSLGAIVAAHHGDRVSPAQIILFGLNPYGDDPQKAQGRHDLARDVAQRGGAAALLPRLGPLLGPDPGHALATILAMADETAAHIDAQTHLALHRPGAMNALSRTKSPVTVLTGTQDQQAPSAQGQAAARIAPQGQFTPLAGLGHYALLEDPAACAKAVLAT